MEKYFKLDCSDFSDFENKKCNNGVLTLPLSSWNEFHNVVSRFNNSPDYVWRGQRCYCEGWKLKSSFDRKIEFPNTNTRQAKLDEILQKFKRRLADLSDSTGNSLSDDEIWAIGQHYGLPTPLLDWTECPYIAAYFAFFQEESRCQTENRVVYALNRAVRRVISKRKATKSKRVLSTQRFVEFPDLMNNLDATQNTRLEKRRSRFTKALNGVDIRTNVKRLVAKKPHYQGRILLAEILIPDMFRDECLRFLESTNITHGTLFPDYAGAVEMCKIDLKIRKSQ